MADFPGELVDSVIDHLSTDTSSLLACGLVSKQWLPRSRNYRFSSVDLFIGGEWKGPRRVHAFLSLTKSSLVTFVPCVVEVHLSHRREQHKGSGQVISPDAILVRLSACGIRPKRLFLNCLLYFSHPLSGLPAFASSLVHLDLQLEDNHINLRSVVDYICAFPLLESLKIWGIPDVITPKLPKSLALPPQLQTMHAGHPLVADWLLTLGDSIPRQLTKLELVNFGRSTFRWSHINRYLGSSAVEHLEALTVSGTKPGYELHITEEPGPNLQHLRCLKHLTIKESHSFAPRTLLDILRSLRLSPASGTLEEITISLNFMTVTRYTAVDWMAVDAVLADATAWPQLRSLTLAMEENRVDGQEYKSHDIRYSLGVLALDTGLDLPIAIALRQHLSRCDERGVLDIVNIPVVEPGS
ncbi:hypothetical protein B0H19DRAFT_1043457 [Mycena capillaripes]|nr:hypothetical protein B0H19DRAFT_1043457 [Mycena capillaripes]